MVLFSSNGVNNMYIYIWDIRRYIFDTHPSNIQLFKKNRGFFLFLKNYEFSKSCQNKNNLDKNVRNEIFRKAI